MARLIRVDAELVRRGMARSRQHAAELIAAGHVLLDGGTVTKAARQMDPARALRVVAPPSEDYASRGAHKLAGALDALGDLAPVVAGRRALDAGASTGGFTDVLLRRGAAHVVAVDVGYGQLAWHLQQDDRVTVLDRTNVRTLDPAAVAPAPELVVADLSFISLTLVLPALAGAAPTARCRPLPRRRWRRPCSTNCTWVHSPRRVRLTPRSPSWDTSWNSASRTWKSCRSLRSWGNSAGVTMAPPSMQCMLLTGAPRGFVDLSKRATQWGSPSFSTSSTITSVQEGTIWAISVPTSPSATIPPGATRSTLTDPKAMRSGDSS